MSETLDKVLLDAIKGLVYESHEEHVDYEEEMGYRDTDRLQSSDSGGGRGVLPMLLLGVAFAAIGYMIGKRSGGRAGDTPIDIQGTSDEVADRTQEMSESAADTVRQGGQHLSERAEEASDRVEGTSEEVGDDIEESGSEASDRMEDSD